MFILIMYQCVYYKYYSFTHFIRNVSEAPTMDIMTSQAFSIKAQLSKQVTEANKSNKHSNAHIQRWHSVIFGYV